MFESKTQMVAIPFLAAYSVRDVADSSALEITTLVRGPQAITYTNYTTMTNSCIPVGGENIWLTLLQYPMLQLCKFQLLGDSEYFSVITKIIYF